MGTMWLLSAFNDSQLPVHGTPEENAVASKELFHILAARFLRRWVHTPACSCVCLKLIQNSLKQIDLCIKVYVVT